MIKEISGISVDFIRKKIKNMYIRVNGDGKVVMSVPLCASEYEAESFFSKYSERVKSILEKQATVNSERKNDNSIFVLGKKKSLEFFVCNPTSVRETEQSLFVGTKHNYEQEKLAEIKKFLKFKLCEKIDEYLQYWQEKTRLYSVGYTIRQTESGWGSCNCSTRKLNFSLYLANMPEICISYVVLHEICHIRYNNHGVGFKSMLSEYMPEWKSIRKLLNDSGSTMKFYKF